MEEGKSISAGILIHAALAAASDLPLSHQRLHMLGADTEAIRDQRGIHIEGLAVEINSVSFPVHSSSLPLLDSQTIARASGEDPDLDQSQGAIYTHKQ